jgi:hypothetical protein
MQFICRLSGSQDQSQSQQRVPFSCYGTRSVGRGREKWEGEAPAETTANGDWRLATGKTAASSEWRVVFWRAVLLHCRKNLLNDCTPHFLFTFARMHTYTHARLHAHRLKPVACKVSEHAIGLFTSGKGVAIMASTHLASGVSVAVQKPS